ncbi:MAG TPA: endonuclease/exonuclease/phosphatase family protein [Ramlibacter sp.]|nr:endonuclease/exonuclease/phosphatase family protein [Ramlibacter sp.]
MKLVTWNTQWCCGIDGTVSPRRIVDGARALADFDVLCLQEIAVNYPRLEGDASHDQPALLRQLLGDQFQLFFGAAVSEWTGAGHQQFGNLIATRLPVLQVQHHPLPYPADGGVCSMPRMCSVVTLRDPVLGPVRIMTTHLEFYSKKQRMAQVEGLRALHAQHCAHAAAPPKPSDDGSPFQDKTHTAHAILCGDFNLEPHEPEYAALTQADAQAGFHDSWRLVHGAQAAHEPTFRLHDRRYGPVPIACDFVFVSEGLKDKVQSIRIDARTQVSDHQPVAVEIG